MIAFCGVNCGECGAYLATRDADEVKRSEVAQEWSQKFGAEMQPETINCLGCSSDGPLFFYCAMCDIRKCASEKGLSTCAHCDDYACEKLEAFFGMSPENKKWLDEIRSNL
jgi:hypothetical protein